MAELKPCPFCGAIPTNEGEYPDKIGICQKPDTGSWTVLCTQCGASVDCFLTKNEALKAWNRRADNG